MYTIIQMSTLPSDLQCEVTSPDTIKSLVDKALIHLDKVFGIEIQGVAKYRERQLLVNKAAADNIMLSELSRRPKTASIPPDSALQPYLF